jgi:hypothetical protein
MMHVNINMKILKIVALYCYDPELFFCHDFTLS